MEPPGIVGVGAVVAGGLAFDQLMLWAERRGWVHWRRTKVSRTALGGAMLEVQRILEPDKGHVVDQRAVERSHIDQADDDTPLD